MAVSPGISKGREMCQPTLEEKVEFLRKPESYPIPTRYVDSKETHMSWVFLTETQAWKLKKPVRYDYLDFSTIEARRHDCSEEVRLNRRLAANVYKGIVPLVRKAQGQLALGEEGEPLDWLVWMRRLPAERMLDQALARHAVTHIEAQQVGMLLARFYRQLAPMPITTSEYRYRLMADVRANRQELATPVYALPLDLVHAISAAQLEFISQATAQLAERVQKGRIIEGHGDLRPEHICLECPPVIIDCLEFNRDFRILDAVSELAFLSLECERLGAHRIGELILETYRSESGDTPSAQLMIFYKSYHACLRAKVAVWHLKDHVPGDWAKWTGRARDYLNLASCILTAKIP